MNTFIKHFDDAFYHEEYISKDQESELIEHILDTSLYQNTAEFALANITYDDALNLVQSNDDFVQESVEHLANQPMHTLLPLLLDNVSMKDLAYHLAYTEPAFGTTLLTELEYYKSKGRI